MNRQKRILTVLLLLPALILALTAQRRPDNIIISGADDSNTLGMTPSTPLETLLEGVAPRIVLQYANALRYYDMTPVSGELDTLLANVGARFRIQYANENRDYALATPPAGLTDLFASVEDRFVLQYANENRPYTLAYPIALIDDGVPPEVSAVDVVVSGGSSAIIRWNTNEFATSEVRYGTAPGNYTDTVTDSWYVKEHQVTLTGLEPGQKYYYRLASTDQSGNRYESEEQSFTLVTSYPVFLPTIIH